MSAENQTKILADFIMADYPEYIIDGGAGDVGIKIIKDLQTKIDAYRTVCEDMFKKIGRGELCLLT